MSIKEIPTRTAAWFRRQSLYGIWAIAGATLLVSASSLVWHRTVPLTSFYSEWLAFVCGLMFAFSLVLMPREQGLRIPAIAIGFFALTLAMGLQLVALDLVYPERVLVAMLYSAWAGVVALAAANLRDRVELETTVLWLQWGFWVAGFIVAISGYAQFYQLKTVFGSIIAADPGRGMIGFVGQRNYFANVVSCGVVSMAYLWARGRIGSLPALLTGVPMLFALAMSSSRSALAFLLLLLIVSVVLYRSMGARDGRRLVFVSVLMLAGYLAGQYVISASASFDGPEGHVATAVSRLVDAATGDRNYMVRERLYHYAWAIFLQHPILGAGMGEYAYESFVLATGLGPNPLPGIDRNAHNFVLQLLAESGLLGAACIVIPLAMWFLRFPYRKAAPGESWLLLIVLMQLAQGSIELPLWYSNLLAFLVLLLGLGARGGVTVPYHGLRRGVIAALVLSGGVTCVATFRDYLAIDNWATGVRSSAGLFGKLTKPQIDEFRAIHGRSLFAPLLELLAAELMVMDNTELEAKFDLNRRGMHYFPTPGSAVRHTIFLSLLGQREQAWTTLQSARIVYAARFNEMRSALLDYESRFPGSLSWLIERLQGELGAGATPAWPPPIRSPGLQLVMPMASPG